MDNPSSAVLDSSDSVVLTSARGPSARWQCIGVCSALAVVTFVSRLPLLAEGYGLDPDALRVVSAARTIRATSQYAYSRAPGYPVQELLVSLLVPGGEWAVNGMTALWSSVAAVAFALCLQELRVRGAIALALALAAVPVIYVNSTCAMDYVWALAFVMVATWLTLRERAWQAGIFLGLAIGTRITSGAMLLPLGILCFARTPNREALRAWVRLTLSALTVGALCFAPVYHRYGLKFFSYSEGVGGGSTEAIFRRATFGVWGPLGCIAIVAASLAALAMLRTTLRAPITAAHRRERRAATLACLTAIVLYVLAYIKLPHEAGYLIPVVPFTIWLIGMWLPTGPNVVLALLLCASPFFDYRSETPWQSAAVPAAQRERREVEELVNKAIDAANRAEAPAVIVAGYRLPAIEAKLGGATQESKRWVYKVKDQAQLDAWRREGYKVYFVDRATEVYQKRINGLRLRSAGAKQLDLE